MEKYKRTYTVSFETITFMPLSMAFETNEEPLLGNMNNLNCNRLKKFA